MTSTNQQSNDDFRLAVVIRVEGRNCGKLVVRIVGVLVALAALVARIAVLIGGVPS